MPPNFQIGSPRVMDSTGALELPDMPETLLVIGGGYIGLEMGTVYAGLGSKVSVVELTDGLLPGADRDLVKPLQKNLREAVRGPDLPEHAKSARWAIATAAVEVAFEGPAKFGIERFDRVLVSVGRRPNSRGLGLENTQVEVNQRGFVVCDKQQRTADPHILAIGDVAGEPMLAHKATHEAQGGGRGGRSASRVVRQGGDPRRGLHRSRNRLGRADGGPGDEGRPQRSKSPCIPWAASGRAQALGRTEGLTKWIIDPETERVLGCGIVGAGRRRADRRGGAGHRNGLRSAATSPKPIHPHPTLSETLMNAGEMFFGTAAEIYKPKKSAH